LNILTSTNRTMSSEDILPTYAEAVKMHQTPWHIIEEEAMHITFREPSATSKIKSFISRTESASQHDVFTGVKRKNKLVVFVENFLTGEYRALIVLRSQQDTNLSLQLEARRSTTPRSPEPLRGQGAFRRQHQKMPSNDAAPFDARAQAFNGWL
jgi:hypothetical protein